MTASAADEKTRRDLSAAPVLLAVDDTPTNLSLLAGLLGDRYRLKVATNGGKALQLAHASPPDLILLDIMMPGMSGYEVLEQLRADASLRDIPVIMISAIDEIDSVIRCIKLGAEDYLPKPFNETLLLTRIGASLEKKRLRDEIVRHVKRMERELEGARQIQLGMVPRAFPEPSPECPLSVYAELRPARETGGDLYDFFWINPTSLCVVVADVSDKGASAALYMARAKTVIRLVASLMTQALGHIPDPGDLVGRINKELCRDNAYGMFVTLYLSIFDGRSGNFQWCNAGHTVPYVVSKDGKSSVVSASPLLPLGLDPTTVYTSGTGCLSPFEKLFIYTDGITEAVNERREFFGDERLQTAIRCHAGGSAKNLVEGVLEELRSFVGNAAPADDIAALACSWGAD